MQIKKSVSEKPTAELGVFSALRRMLYQIRGIREDDRQTCDRFQQYSQPFRTSHDSQKNLLSAVYKTKLEIARGYYEPLTNGVPFVRNERNTGFDSTPMS